jgi:hypothetical protein
MTVHFSQHWPFGFQVLQAGHLQAGDWGVAGAAAASSLPLRLALRALLLQILSWH